MHDACGIGRSWWCSPTNPGSSRQADIGWTGYPELVLIVGLVLAGVAALIHVYIFYLESVAWTKRPGRAVFGLTAEQAESTKELAFNQGFYNLFLAIITVLGIVFVAADRLLIGSTLVLAGVGSMLAASLVLVGSDRGRLRAALVQGLFPLLAIVLLVIGLAA